MGAEKQEKILKEESGSSKQKQNVHSRLGKRPRLNSGIYVKKDENSVVTITDSEDEEDESENNRTSIIKNDTNNSSDSECNNLNNSDDKEDIKIIEDSTLIDATIPKTTNESDSGTEVLPDNESKKSLTETIDLSSDDDDDEESEESYNKNIYGNGLFSKKMYDQAIRIFGSIDNAQIIHGTAFGGGASGQLTNCGLGSDRSKLNIINNGKPAVVSTHLDKHEHNLMLTQRKQIEKAATNRVAFDYSQYPFDRITICIEEPFQRDNVARAVFDKEKALRIIKTLRFIRQKIEDMREAYENETEDAQYLSMSVIKSICQEYLNIQDENQVNSFISVKNRKRGYSQINQGRNNFANQHDFIDDSETEEESEEEEEEEDDQGKNEDKDNDYVIIDDDKD